MKLKELFYLLGVRPGLRRHGHRIDHFELASGETIQFANWLHPAARPKSVETPQIAALRTFLKPGDTAIDIGSHIGDTTVPMALAAGPEGCVFGFKPNPFVFEVLKANADLNPGLTRIIPLPYAAGDSAGKLTFRYSDPGLCNGGELRGLSRWRHAHAFEIEVEAVHAETWLREHFPRELAKLRYIKVDSEGADPRILRSMDGILREFRPYLRCEIYRHLPQDERKQFFRFLLDRGYSIHRFISLTEYQGPRLGIEDVSRLDHYDIFAEPEGET